MRTQTQNYVEQDENYEQDENFRQFGDYYSRLPRSTSDLSLFSRIYIVNLFNALEWENFSSQKFSQFQVYTNVTQAKQYLLLLNNFYPVILVPTSSKGKESDELLYTVARYGPRNQLPAQEG